MALVPSHHLYYPTASKTTTLLDSFQSRFHGTALLLLNKNRRIPLKNLTFYATHNGFSSNAKNPPKNYNPHSLSINRNTSSAHDNTWLRSWNKPDLQNGPKAPSFALNYRSNRDSINVSGDGGGSTMDKIVEKLKKFGYIDGDNENKEVKPERVIEKGSVEDIFYVEEGMLPNTRGGFSKESPFGDKNPKDVTFPWERTGKVERAQEGATQKWTARKQSRTSMAELTLPESELRRLINLTFRIKNKTKVKGAGVTPAVVDAIHEKWKVSEIARVKVEGPPALNMKRMHEILEV